MRGFAIAALAILLLSGCSYREPDRHFTVPEDAPSAMDTVDGDGYTLRVQVVDLNGSAVQGAAVVLFEAVSSGAASFDGSASPEGATGSAQWRIWSNDDVVAGLRTGPDGVAQAELEPGGSINVAAGGIDAHTTELRLRVAVGAAGDQGTLSLPLYPAQRTVTFAATAQNMFGTAGLASPAYETFAIPFDDQHDAGFHDRLDAASITMTWTNLPAQAADFYVGLSAGDEEPFLLGQDSQQIDAGEQSESLQATPQDIDRDAIRAAGASVAAVTDRAALGVDGVPLTFTVDAEFRGSNVVIQ